jgi:hypothetical protein
MPSLFFTVLPLQLTRRPRRLHLLLGESLTESDARAWMFFDWDKVNRAGVSFRLLSVFMEDLPQLVIQGAAAANSSEAMSTVAVASISLSAVYVAVGVLRSIHSALIWHRSLLLGVAGEIARRVVDRINVEVRGFAFNTDNTCGIPRFACQF